MARISELIRAGRTYSFEFFPPRNDEEQAILERTIRDLEPLRPAYVSVTYRGGASSRHRTTAVVFDILRTTGITPMPHLTCVAHPRAELIEIVSNFHDAGLENLLALGGDPLPEATSHRELTYAIELVELAREVGVASIGVAAHPAGHPRSPSLAADRRALAAKLSVADFAITQFFFQVEEWERLVEELAALGVHKPVIAGVMPITNLSSISRMARLAGCEVPPRVVDRLLQVEHDPVRFRQLGIELASQLCSDLIQAGVPGLHFYTLNRSSATREIYRALNLAPRE